MKTVKIILMLLLAIGMTFSANAADKVTIQLKWVTQAQFAV